MSNISRIFSVGGTNTVVPTKKLSIYGTEFGVVPGTCTLFHKWGQVVLSPFLTTWTDTLIEGVLPEFQVRGRTEGQMVLQIPGKGTLAPFVIVVDSASTAPILVKSVVTFQMGDSTSVGVVTSIPIGGSTSTVVLSVFSNGGWQDNVTVDRARVSLITDHAISILKSQDVWKFFEAKIK